MSLLLTPTIIAAFIVSGIFAIWGMVLLYLSLASVIRHKRRSFKLLKVDSKEIGGKLGDFIKPLKPPFVFEIAIPQLGRELNYYLVVSSKMVKAITNKVKAKEVQDYNVYHPGGSHLGVYLKSKGEEPKKKSRNALSDKNNTWLDLGKFDFSKVNAIGEGVAIQFLINKKQKKRLAANIRIMISATSPYRAREILSSLKPALAPYKLVETGSSSFIHRVNYREFSDKELLLL